MKLDEESLAILQGAFPDMPVDEAKELITYGLENNYPTGTILCSEGAIENKFYIILDGEVRITKRINESEERYLKHLRNGEFFGEMALIHNAPRTATVITQRNTRVLEIDKKAFDFVLQSSTSVAVAMVREVSRRLRENDELAIEDLRLKAGEIAVAYQKLAEMEFARRDSLTTIAHELRTPLTSASGFLEAARMGMLQGEALDRALEVASENMQKIIKLVNDILFLQEINLILPKFQPVNIIEVINTAIESVQVKAEKNQVNLNLQKPAEIPLIPGDSSSLERAFTALLDNAIKFSLDGGNVDINVDASDPQRVTIYIQDHGVGIPEDRRERIFERFFHTDTDGEHLFAGVGLGLSIAQQVIEQHRGRIELESEMGIGSTFIIRLPIKESE